MLIEACVNHLAYEMERPFPPKEQLFSVLLRIPRQNWGRETIVAVISLLLFLECKLLPIIDPFFLIKRVMFDSSKTSNNFLRSLLTPTDKNNRWNEDEILSVCRLYSLMYFLSSTFVYEAVSPKGFETIIKQFEMLHVLESLSYLLPGYVKFFEVILSFLHKPQVSSLMVFDIKHGTKNVLSRILVSSTRFYQVHPEF